MYESRVCDWNVNLKLTQSTSDRVHLHCYQQYLLSLSLVACRWHAPCCIHGAQLVHISRPVIKHKLYHMEAKRYMAHLLEMPLSLAADNAVRRLDIGCNRQHRGVPLFSLSQGANGHVSTIWHLCTLLNLCFYRPFQCCARVAALSNFNPTFTWKPHCGLLSQTLAQG